MVFDIIATIFIIAVYGSSFFTFITHCVTDISASDRKSSILFSNDDFHITGLILFTTFVVTACLAGQGSSHIGLGGYSPTKILLIYSVISIGQMVIFSIAFAERQKHKKELEKQEFMNALSGT